MTSSFVCCSLLAGALDSTIAVHISSLPSLALDLVPDPPSLPGVEQPRLDLCFHYHHGMRPPYT
ncbi:hypothetical protein K488DRAFT_92287 [Vararia minispora EC-137]|uniref:Uncharacterized protein n=1 Tax=Vararia minispora EC-137 TaxID=1314806 RepID=A0ACB8Q488_9AGAM|nr:hypothetical protein K488DRAFT_92287 [Vararia minispora EC-137]